MENTAQTPETTSTPDTAPQAQAPAPQPAATPSPQQPHPYALLLDARYSADHLLGAAIDVNSYKLLCLRSLEYEVTIKQLAGAAVVGNKDGFEQMVNQLQGAIYQNQLFLVNMLRKVMESKASALAVEKKEPANDPSAASETSSQATTESGTETDKA